MRTTNDKGISKEKQKPGSVTAIGEDIWSVSMFIYVRLSNQRPCQLSYYRKRGSQELNILKQKPDRQI